MRSEKLSNLIELQVKTIATGSRGEQTPNWVSRGEYWARIKPLSIGQKMVAAASMPAASHKVTIRYVDEIASPHFLANARILFGTRIFSILGGIDVDEKRQWYEFTVEEGVNDG